MCARGALYNWRNTRQENGVQHHGEQGSTVALVSGRGDARRPSAAACGSAQPDPASAGPAWERENPIKPPAPAPLGMEVFFEDTKPPSPASVRLGRWLFYDTRLSADNTLACASCHKPEYAFSEATAVSTGIRGQKGTRKAPTFINKAVTLAPHFFWDGRASSLEDQALGPIANPIEMGNTHEAMIATLSRRAGLHAVLQGSIRHRGRSPRSVSPRRLPTTSARASAATHPTIAGGSIASRTRCRPQPSAVTISSSTPPDARQCHTGSSFSDSLFHNLGVGWDPQTTGVQGRGTIRGHEEARGPRRLQDAGAARRQQARRPTCTTARSRRFARSSSCTTRAASRTRISTKGRLKPLGLKDEDVDAIVAFLKSLDGEGYQDTPPTSFPQ